MFIFDVVYAVVGAYFTYMFYEVIRGIVRDYRKR